VSANDLAKVNNIIAILEPQLAKQKTGKEEKANKESLKKTTERALKVLMRGYGVSDYDEELMWEEMFGQQGQKPVDC